MSRITLITMRLPQTDRQRHRCLIVLSALASAHLSAQQPLSLSRTTPFADACRAERVIRLPIADSLRYPLIIASVTVDDRGQLYLTDSRGVGAFVFDSAGRPLLRVGRRGQGPGEFSSITQVTRSRSGRFYVLDQVGMTIGVLDSMQRELYRIRTRGIGGRRLVLQHDSLPVISGHYDLGRTDRQLAAFAADGTLLWSAVALPPLLRRLTPRIDLSFATMLANGDIIAGSGLVPELWLLSKGRTMPLPLPMSTRWTQIAPLAGPRSTPAQVAEWLSRSTVAYEAVTVGDRVVAVGFGTDVALVDVGRMRTALLTDAPGALAAGSAGRLMMIAPPEDAENVLTWFRCELP